MNHKTGGWGTEWTNYDTPKPAAVGDHYAYWGDPPPKPSERCTWWLRQINRGWRPNRRISAEGYDAAAQWYGVYIWEYFNLISPTLRALAQESD